MPSIFDTSLKLVNLSNRSTHIFRVLWPLALVVRASFLNELGWFLPPLYFLYQISKLKIVEPNWP